MQTLQSKTKLFKEWHWKNKQMLWNVIGMPPPFPPPQSCHLLMTVAKVNDPLAESLPHSYYNSAHVIFLQSPLSALSLQSP